MSREEQKPEPEKTRESQRLTMTGKKNTGKTGKNRKKHTGKTSSGHVTAHGKDDSEYLFWWRHLDTSSERLLSSVFLSAEAIISFSVIHRSHRFDTFEYAGAFLRMLQSIRKSLFAFLSLQMCFESSVWLAYLPCLKLIVWFANRCLNAVSVEPMYTLGA